MKRRAPRELTIGQSKAHKRLALSRLIGEMGDKLSVIVAANAALNLHKLMKALAGMLAVLALFLVWLLDLTEPLLAVSRLI